MRNQKRGSFEIREQRRDEDTRKLKRAAQSRDEERKKMKRERSANERSRREEGVRTQRGKEARRGEHEVRTTKQHGTVAKYAKMAKRCFKICQWHKMKEKGIK